MPNSHFDIIARIYDRVIKYTDSEVMISQANLPVAGTLLDAGGGTGRVAESLRGHVEKIVIADLSYGMLRQATDKGLATTCAELETLPFPDASFERIIMMDTLHHVTDQQVTADELWRVLKPGGRLVVVEPDITCFVVKLIAVFEKLVLMRSHFLSQKHMKEVFYFPDSSASVALQNCSIWLTLDKK